MNISSRKSNPDFIKKTLSFEFTSQKEVEEFYALFCHAFVMDGVNIKYDAAVRQELENLYGPVTYMTAHKNLSIFLTKKFKQYPEN